MKDELIQGILRFWGTVDTAKCLKYIGHLRKVIPKVIELEGAATGYYSYSYMYVPIPWQVHYVSLTTTSLTIMLVIMDNDEICIRFT